MYYDHSVKGLPEIKSHATVRIRMGKTWEPATVTAQHTAPRSYLVLACRTGVIFCVNRGESEANARRARSARGARGDER